MTPYRETPPAPTDNATVLGVFLFAWRQLLQIPIDAWRNDRYEVHLSPPEPEQPSRPRRPIAGPLWWRRQ